MDILKIAVCKLFLVLLQAKMKAEKLSNAAIAAFRHSYMELVSGAAGMIKESDIEAVQALPNLETDIRGKMIRHCFSRQLC